MTTIDAASLRAKVEAEGADKAASDLRKVGQEANTAKDHLSGMGGGFSTLKNAFMSGIGVVTGAISGFLGYKAVGDVLGFVKDQLMDVMQAGMDQQKVQAQTAAVIKSTGGAAHMSADQIGDLADKYARLTGVSDDQIQSAENILLTFTDIKSNIFPQVTQTVLDMAQAFHQDLQTSAIEVGKALQDPVAGATALRRVGVQLSDEQMKLIKHFVATGDKAKAQAIIMKELTRETGGSAEAAGKTLPGMLAILNVSFDQMKEKVGLAVIPVLQSLVNKYLMPAADWIGDHLPAAIDILTTFLDTKLVPALDAFMESPVVKTVEGWADAFANTLVPSLDDKKGVAHAADKASKSLGEKGMAGAGGKAKSSLSNLSTQMGTTGKDIGDGKSGFIGHVNAGTVSVLGLADAIDPKGDGDTTSHALAPAVRRYRQSLIDLNDNQTRFGDTIKKQTGEVPGWQKVVFGMASTFDGFPAHVDNAINALGQFKDAVIERFAPAQPAMFKIMLGISSDLGKWSGQYKGQWGGLWSALTAAPQIAFHTIEGLVIMGFDTLGALSTGNWEKVRKDWVKEMAKIMGDVQQFVNGVANLIAQLHLPDWMTGASKAFGFASGTNDAPGGPALVGENGPEYIYLPRHSVVKTASETRAIQARQQQAAMSGSSGGRSGNTYITNVYPQQTNLTMRDLARIQRRRELLISMGGAA